MGGDPKLGFLLLGCVQVGRTFPPLLELFRGQDGLELGFLCFTHVIQAGLSFLAGEGRFAAESAQFLPLLLQDRLKLLDLIVGQTERFLHHPYPAHSHSVLWRIPNRRWGVGV